MTIIDHETILTFSAPPEVTAARDPEDNEIVTVTLDGTVILIGTSETLQELATAILTHLIIAERDQP